MQLPQGHESGIQDTHFVVYGQVTSHERSDLAGLHVRAIDRNVGQDVDLGETTTDADGHYRIEYQVAPLQQRGKARPDVQIQVSAEAGGDVLAASDIHYDAGREARIDVTVPAEKLPRRSESHRLRRDLSAHLGDHADLSQLQEDEERQDVTYLANKTGWDARKVATTALADQFSQESGIEPEFFYALFQAGVPANGRGLSQTVPATVTRIWKKAVDDAVIPEEKRAQIPEAVERFNAYSADRLLEAPPTVGVSSFGELLDVSLGTDDERKQRVAQLYQENQGNLDAFWNNMRVEFGDAATDRLQLDGQLSFLTINNAALIDRLRQNYGDMQTPLDLVQNGLYRQEAWMDLLDEGMEIPSEIPGADADEKKQNYAGYMTHQLQLSYPTAFVAEKIEQGEIPLGAGQQLNMEVYNFLRVQKESFELGVHPVEEYLQKHQIDLSEEALDQIKKVQRMYQVSSSDEVMGALLANKIDSAYAMMQYDEQEFVEVFQDELGGAETARLTYAKAHQIHNATLNIATSFLLQRSAPTMYGLADGEDARSRNAGGMGPGTDDRTRGTRGAGAESGVLAYPTLEGIFGEMDYCTCGHCRSVLSPAAYLVNLLQFIDGKKYDSIGRELPTKHEKEIPLEVLLARRPDIQHIQLTCENTNTVLPYIDLVNEILEYFVVSGIDDDRFSLDGFEGHNNDGRAATEQLMANPQFVKHEAYDHLRQELLFPRPLPFHQPLEALRCYFDHFDTPLHLAMERLHPGDSLDGTDGNGYGWRDILMERIGLSPQEHRILTDSTIPLPKLYGEDPDTVTVDELITRLRPVDAGSDPVGISNVKLFTRRLGISYEELIEIVRTRFINPHGDLLPRLEQLGVSFAAIRDLHRGVLSEDDFRSRLPDDLDESAFDGDVIAWIDRHHSEIRELIVLTDPTGSDDPCAFDQFEIRYALPHGVDRVDVGWTPMSVNHNWSDVSFTSTFEAPAVVLTAMQTREGGDTAATRLRRRTESGFEIKIEEEQSANDEVRHASEQIAYLATAPGAILDAGGNRIGEAGLLRAAQPDEDTWHYVELRDRYTNPVVLLQLMSYGDTAPAHTRLDNVKSDSFEWQIEEWAYQDGAHRAEHIGYIVLEQGRHRLADGAIVEVGTVETNHHETDAEFSETFSTRPAVFSHCQTTNDGQPVVTRQRHMSRTGLRVRLQEEEAHGTHDVETVGYAAILPAGRIEVGRPSHTVNHGWSDVAFEASYRSPPVVVAAMQTIEGPDPAGVRLRSWMERGFEIKVEEEQSANSETWHAGEEIGYLAATPGAIHDEDGNPIGEAGIVEHEQEDAGTWRTVNLAHDYDDPVVVMQLLSSADDDPAHIRVQNVTNHSFQFQIEAWKYMTDQTHDLEQIGYVVLEQGRHRLADGTIVEVGTFHTNHGWADVKFSTIFPSTPVVVSQCQTTRGGEPVVTRQQQCDRAGLEIRLQEEEARGRHKTETIGYIAALVRNRASDPKQLKPTVFLKLLRFIRLWQKLGWSIEDTDKAITALYPDRLSPQPTDTDEKAKQQLDQGMDAVLLRQAQIIRVMQELKLNPQRELLPLLALFAPIDTHGNHSLYRRMFLNPAIMELDDAFQGDDDGVYLSEDEKIAEHIEALRAAFNLTPEEWSLIWNYLGYDEDTDLTVTNITQIFRRGYLARQLGISVRELLALQTLSGIDPFTPLEPVQPAILRFIELAQLIDESPFDISQLLYFLQHEDLSGNASPPQADLLAFARRIRRDLARIDRQYRIEEDPNGEAVREKMALVYGNEAADIFFGLVNDTASYSVSYSQDSSELDRALRDVTGNIAYHHLQEQLAFDGVMTETVRSALTGVSTVSEAFQNAVNELFDAGQAEFQTFFENYPELQVFHEAMTIGNDRYSIEYRHERPELNPDLQAVTDKLTYNHDQARLTVHGIIPEPVLAELIRRAGARALERALEELVEKSWDGFQQDVDEFLVRYEEFFARYPGMNELFQSFDFDAMDIFVGTFLPALRQKLKRQQVRQTVSAQIDTALPLANSLLEMPALVHVAGQAEQPAIADFLNLETQGVTATYLAAGGSAPIYDGDVAVPGINYHGGGMALPPHPDSSADPIGGLWSWHLEAPDNGLYNFYVEAGAGATISLSLDGEPVKLNHVDGAWTNEEAIELEAGHLYAMELTAMNMGERLILKWQSKGLAREPIPASYLYPETLLHHFTTTYLRLLKAITIVEELELSATEIEYFGTHGDYHVDGEGWLNALPAAPASAAASTTHALLRSFTTLLRYVRLREALRVQDDRLLRVLEDPAAKNEEGYLLLYQLTGWDERELDIFLHYFDLARSDLGHLPNLSRIHEAFGVAEALGIGAQTLLQSVTNNPSAETVRNLQGALRARYDEDVWVDVLQPINDELRQRQRDALVAFVLHKLQQAPATEHIDTADKLFEYFLIDVQMDPCMVTSRIKQAISTVQLFIQRCLMNLEPQVASSSINAKQWQWMKRYRVWEANRKVFLWPENWLEPELRDNKSPFFEDFESELLESDITDRAAATALLHYLEKLDQVAKLEICGMYVDEKENSADDVVHVIGRTAGAGRKYFYRRLARTGWTPWQPVDLEIEDNPVVPVVWRGRLFLFWLTVVQKGPNDQKLPVSNDDESITKLTAKDLQGDAEVEVTVSLNWSEYYNGKWQPARTSDVNKPLDLLQIEPGKFDRSALTLRPSESASALQIHLDHPELGSGDIRYFTLYSARSLPSRASHSLAPGPFPTGGWWTRSFTDEDGSLTIGNFIVSESESWQETVLGTTTGYEIIEPRHVGPLSVYRTSFFFQDQRHVFFVRTSVLRSLSDYSDIVLSVRRQEFRESPIYHFIETGDPVLSDGFGTDLLIPGD